MKELIDIYAKILVATFGFIGPSFTLLISIFVEPLEKSRIIYEQQIKTLDILTINANQKSLDPKDKKELQKSLKQTKKQKKKVLKELNLLNPRRQIRHVFIPLIFSLIFICIYYYQHTRYCDFVNPFKTNLLCWLIISVICFLYCLFVLRQILETVIEAKQNIVKQETDIILQEDEETTNEENENPKKIN